MRNINEVALPRTRLLTSEAKWSYIFSIEKTEKVLCEITEHTNHYRKFCAVTVEYYILMKASRKMVVTAIAAMKMVMIEPMVKMKMSDEEQRVVIGI